MPRYCIECDILLDVTDTRMCGACKAAALEDKEDTTCPNCGYSWDEGGESG